MSIYSSTFAVEKLIQTIARAFYNDDVIIVLDALVREKYIREEELGPRLRLPQRKVREVIAILMEKEMFVKYEDVAIADITIADSLTNKSSTTDRRQKVRYYYIDYLSFVNMIRFRVYKMLKDVETEESQQVDVSWSCPTCKRQYAMFEATKLVSKDFKFVCSDCCPEFNISQVISQDYFRLVEINRSGKLSEVQLLYKKMKEQLSQSTDHDGILELLNELKDKPITRNKPSNHIRRGVRSSLISSYEISAEINEAIDSKKVTKQQVDITERKFNLLSTRFDGQKIESEASKLQQTIEEVKPIENATVHKKSRTSELPDFLQSSGVIGTSSVLEQIQSLQEQRGQVTTKTSIAVNNKQNNSKVLLMTNNKKITTNEDVIIDDEENANAEDIEWE